MRRSSHCRTKAPIGLHPVSQTRSLGVMMEPEVGDGAQATRTGIQGRGGSPGAGPRGERGAGGPRSRPACEPLRNWVKVFEADPQFAFPGKGQMKPEQLEIERLRREVQKLKSERDILKKAAAYFAKEST